MGLFLRQHEPRSQLQSKVAADLAERLNTRALETDDTKPQPAILDNQRPTSSWAWLWLVLGVIVVAGIIFVLVR